MSLGILYISYDGMLEPLGQSQVLAYIEKLAAGRRIHVISFEKPQDWRDLDRRSAVAARMNAVGIVWHPLRYHKQPTAPATAYDVACGTSYALALVVRHRLSIVHARSYVPALIALTVKKVTGAKFLFDMRGLWADERVDGGLWPTSGRLYRMTKELEGLFLTAADYVVTLTRASELEIRTFPYLANCAPPIAVIPTCADLQRFSVRGALPQEPLVLGYAGSVGTWYLLDEALRCFHFFAEEAPNSRLLVVNRNEQELIWQRVKALEIDPTVVTVVGAEHQEMPALIRRMSAGMAIIKPVYSKIASAPTKVAEYLGCGVPCLGNVGVGDIETILESRRVGIALRGFSEDELRSGVRRLIGLIGDPDVQDRCRQTATEIFSLERGVAAYEAVYEALEGSPYRREAAQ